MRKHAGTFFSPFTEIMYGYTFFKVAGVVDLKLLKLVLTD